MRSKPENVNVSGALPFEAQYVVKVAKVAKDQARQEGENNVKLIESARVPEGSKGHNVDIRV